MFVKKLCANKFKALLKDVKAPSLVFVITHVINMSMLILEIGTTAAVSHVDSTCETIVYLLLSAHGSSI